MPSKVLRRLVYRPQQVWIRKAIFQIHLWIGLLLSLYVVLIGFSGSVLVFRQELTRFAEMPPRQQLRADARWMETGTALQVIGRRFPKTELTFLYTPREDEPVFDAYLLRKGETTLARLDAVDGKTLATMSVEHSALGLAGRLHYYLLLPRSTGLAVNGVGAALLLTLTITGMVIWWPGLRRWQQGLVIDFRRNWKRINFDSHSAVGFWTLAIVSFWALSGIFFVVPKQVTNLVNLVSKVSPEMQKVVSVPHHSGKQAAPEMMIQAALRLYPEKRLVAVGPARESREPFTVYLTNPGETDLRNADFVYFNPTSGEHVDTIHRGKKRTAGDWIIWSMYPLHFGTSWGMSVKILYALLGLSLPVLSITGVWMYWNRYLGKKWRSLSQPS